MRRQAATAGAVPAAAGGGGRRRQQAPYASLGYNPHSAALFNCSAMADVSTGPVHKEERPGAGEETIALGLPLVCRMQRCALASGFPSQVGLCPPPSLWGPQLALPARPTPACTPPAAHRPQAPAPRKVWSAGLWPR